MKNHPLTQWLQGFALMGWIFLAVPLQGFAAFQSIRNIQSDHWQTSDGLPNHNVVSLVQTGDAYVWLGTTGSTNSLVRFNGVEFASPAPMTAGGDRDHTRLASGREGSLWITKSSNTNSLVRWQHGQAARFEIALPRPGARGIPLYEDQRGNLWLGGGGLLVRTAEGHVQRFPTFAEQFGEVRQIAEDGSGTIWLATSRGLVRCQPDGFDRPYPITNRLTGVFCSRDGSMWVGSDLEPALVQITSRGGLITYARAEGLGPVGVWAMCEDAETNLWVGTYSGLYCVREGRAFAVEETDLRTAFIFSLLYDREGSLWIGTADGLYRIRNNPIEHYGSLDGLGPVSSITAGPSGIWASIFSRGIFRREGEVWTNRVAIPDLLGDFRFMETTQGDLWVATDTRCYRVRNGRTIPMRTIEGRAVFCEAGDRIWIVTPTNLFSFHDETLTSIGNGWPAMSITAVITNRDGGVLIGSSKGLFEWSGKLSQTLDLGKQIPGSRITALEWEGETLWLATDKAVARRRYDWKSIDAEGVLSELGRINSMLVERDNLWFGCANGLFRIRRSDVDHYLEGAARQLGVVQFGKAQGMRAGYLGGSPWGQGAARGAEGRLWFASKTGVVAVNPKGLRDPEPPPLVIEHVLLDQRTAPGFPKNPEAEINVPPGTSSVEIHYAALTYVEPGKAVYRYRLKGLDPEWAHAGNNRVARFTKLPPGEYEFEVHARNASGAWNENGSRVHFVQEPFFHQTRAFLILCLLLGIVVLLLLAAGATAVAHGISTRKMRQRLALVEAHQALDRERARIARDIHDDIGSTLTRIVLLTELAGREPEQVFTPEGHLSAIRGAAREITRRLDEIVWAINPRNDTLDALVSYLSKLATDLARTAGLRCQLTIPPVIPRRPMNGAERLNIFLACKEAMHNAIKHASARKLQLRMTLQEDGFTLEICDDGVGLPSAIPEQRGDGLGNMRERLAKLGGTCEFNSVPGEGTTVRFKVMQPRLESPVSIKQATCRL